MFIDWVFGILFRPGATFDRAQRELRLGYWWILLSVLTLDAVSAVYSPSAPGSRAVSSGEILLDTVVFDLLLFDLQAGLLYVLGRAFRWSITWTDALKFTGLGWSFLLAADVATFYPSVLGHYATVLWGTIPFFLWELLAVISGVRRLSGLARWKSLAVAVLACIPWQAGIVWLGWVQLHT